MLLRRMYPMISDDAFFFQVTDDSMVGFGIAKDSMMLVDPKAASQNGNIVLVRYGDGYLVRKLYCCEDYRIELRAANEQYKTLYVDPLEIRLEGVVLNTIQKTD